VFIGGMVWEVINNIVVDIDLLFMIVVNDNEWLYVLIIGGFV